ncbi:MAG: ImmA/IrrE family metallo-endopeptidase [Candidatus Gastranaerophilales bacterium]|nr:ImmA/IrrE family metallo-endopeptidase [Candidatus Gastranaerophilales bacterium]
MLKEKFNGNRLKAARLYRAMTLDELSKQIDVSKQAISQYENCEIIPEPSKIFKIMTVLGFPKDYFLQEDKMITETKATYFRSLLGTNKKDRIAQIKKGEYIAILYDFLAESIKFPKFNIPNLEIKETNESIDYDALTLEIRMHWGLSQDPIQDLVYELEKSGIIITSLTSTSKSIDAYSQKLKTSTGEKYLIVLTTNKETKARRQFSCAHELAHIILHNWNEDLESMPKSEFSNIENQANKFAAAFLLPKEAFIKDISKSPLSLNTYIKLKLKWHTSIAAMMMRAKDLEIITPSQYQNMVRKYSYRGWRNGEPYDNDLLPSNPTVLKSATKKILEGKKWDGESFVRTFSQKYNVCLSKNEIEELLNLDQNTLSTECNDIINIENKIKNKF